MKKIFLFSFFCFAVFSFTACNVTRSVTTTATHYVSGDTTTTIQTRTVESYDATKKNN